MLATTVARRMLSPFVPYRKMLPFMYWLHRMDGSCEPELAHLDRIGRSSGTAVDIGAHNGFYTYPLSKSFKRVYAFEINDEITGWIHQYNPGNIEIVHCGLSSSAGVANFYIPVLHGSILSGWGSLDRDNLPEAEEHREKKVRVARLDDFGITNIGFVKIDVEGHEVEVLKGAAATIGESRPTVLIEVRDRNLPAVDSWFLNFSYQRCRLSDLVGVPGNRENYLYVPNEQLANFNGDGE